MAKQTPMPDANATSLEDRIVTFAEQVGWVVGLAQAKAEGWAQNTQLKERLTWIRDEASSLLTKLDAGSDNGERQPTPSQTPGSPAKWRASDPAHAPGKRHRKPMPSRRGVKHSSQQKPRSKRTGSR